MAHLVVTFHGKEQRRKLDGPVTIGRALDCDLWVEDISLSRKHCRIEPGVSGWVIVDLNSRNGTRVNGESVTLHQLEEGDEVVIGKTLVKFHSYDFVPERPTDPTAALLSPGAKLPAPRHAAPKRPLPSPKISNAETLVGHTENGDAKPLPFTRPPARPIVKPQEADES